MQLWLTWEEQKMNTQDSWLKDNHFREILTVNSLKNLTYKDNQNKKT